MLLKFWGTEIVGNYFTILSFSLVSEFFTFSYFSYFSNYLVINFRNLKFDKAIIFINQYINKYWFFIIFFNFLICLIVIFLFENKLVNYSSKLDKEIIFIIFLFFLNSTVNQKIFAFYGVFRFLKKIHHCIYIEFFFLISKLLLFLILLLNEVLTLQLLAIINFIFALLLFTSLWKVLFNNKILIKFNFSSLNKINLKNKMKYITSFFLKSLSDYLIIHFSVILISIFHNGLLVSIFVTHRILSRIIIKISQTLTIPLSEEAGILFKTKKYNLYKKNIFKSLIYVIIISFIYYLLIYKFGEEIYNLFADKNLSFSNLLFTLIFLSTFFEMLWFWMSSLNYGTNTHYDISINYFILSTTGMTLFALFLFLFSLEVAIINLILINFFSFLYILNRNFKKS